MSDYPGAIDYFVDRSRVFINQNSHSAIVLHGTGGNPAQTAQQLGDYFRTTPLFTSSHYGIDRAGVICQYVLESDGAAANCCTEPGYDVFWNQFGGDNLNLHTISIEHVNDATNSLPLTAAQQAASFALIGYLCKKYSIPFSAIKSHGSIAPLSRANCPGPYSWTDLLTFLQQGATMIPQGWTDNPQTKVLTSPNGIAVPEPYRAFLLDPKNAWNAANYPLHAVETRNPLEVSNPGLGSGTRLVCRWTVLEETGKGVFVAWAGQELLAVEQQNAALRQQVASLQQQLVTPANISQAVQQIAAAQAALQQISTAQTALSQAVTALGKH